MGVEVVHIVNETAQALCSEESKSGHNIVSLTVSHLEGLVEPLNVHGVKQGGVVVSGIGLIEKTHNLVSIKRGVAFFVESTFRSRYKVHSEVLHAVGRSEVDQVGGFVIQKLSFSPLFRSQSLHGNFSLVFEVL